MSIEQNDQAESELNSEDTPEQELTMSLIIATTTKNRKKKKHFLNLAKKGAQSLSKDLVECLKQELINAHWQADMAMAIKNRNKVIAEIEEVKGYEH